MKTAATKHTPPSPEAVAKFAERLENALNYLVRVRAVMFAARDRLQEVKEQDPGEADYDLMALVDVACEAAMDGIESIPPMETLGLEGSAT